jgi:hypothetical protein
MVSRTYNGTDEHTNRMIKVRPVTDDDIGMRVLYEPDQQRTDSQAQVVEYVSSYSYMHKSCT